ncbi:MAG: hypothetical protein R3D71_05965 [Rickettsiales bacterium]
MNRTFGKWMLPVTLNIITQNIEDGLVVERVRKIDFKGMIQPLSAEKMESKPEGWRSWQWLQIHAVAGILNLSTNDIIDYDGIKYKIMSVYDYSLNGFIEYHCVRDYEQISGATCS